MRDESFFENNSDLADSDIKVEAKDRRGDDTEREGRDRGRKVESFIGRDYQTKQDRGSSPMHGSLQRPKKPRGSQNERKDPHTNHDRGTSPMHGSGQRSRKRKAQDTNQDRGRGQDRRSPKQERDDRRCGKGLYMNRIKDQGRDRDQDRRSSSPKRGECRSCGNKRETNWDQKHGRSRDRWR